MVRAKGRGLFNVGSALTTGEGSQLFGERVIALGLTPAG